MLELATCLQPIRTAVKTLIPSKLYLKKHTLLAITSTDKIQLIKETDKPFSKLLTKKIMYHDSQPCTAYNR